MKKVLSVWLALTLCIGIFTACSAPTASQSAGASGDKMLNLYTWEGMFPKDVLDDFTAQSGIAVNYASFDTDETMLAKLETAKGGDYDLIIADDYIIESAIKEGLVQKLDKTKIPNFSNVNPFYQSHFYDPENLYTVPYGAGVQTIVYDPSAVDFEIKGFADLWNAALKDSLAVIASYRLVTGMALKVMGESYNTTDIAKIEAAGKKMLELAPNIRLIRDDNLQDDLLSGEIDVALMYTSQVTRACLANPKLKVVFPVEGVGFGVMGQFIPVNAPHPAAAHAFINYFLQPEIAKRCFEASGYYCTNSAADALIDPAYQPFLTLPKDFTIDTEMIENITAEANEAHIKAWTAFKTACGR